MKKILVAVDGSPPSLVAARLALQLAKATGAQLTAAYVAVPMMMTGAVPIDVVPDIVDAERARGREVLQEVARELGAPDLAQTVVEGPAAESLAELAEREKFELVVVGSRGRNAVARVLLGSVADRLVHVCKQPVLVAR